MVGVDSEIGWLKVTPDEEALTNFKQVVGLLFGLFFQVLPIKVETQPRSMRQ